MPQLRVRRFHSKTKPPLRLSKGGFVGISSLTMSYFHTGIRTIIGAEVFHCPVRDGKEWGRLAMVIKLKRGGQSLLLREGSLTQFIEYGISFLIALALKLRNLSFLNVSLLLSKL